MSRLIKILAQTSCRSDFDLLAPVYRALHQDPRFDFRLIISGAHLSRTFGYTARQVHATGLPVLAQIQTLLDSDRPSGRLLNASLLLSGAVAGVERFAPDLLLVPGDREDAMAMCLLGVYLKIPIAHFFGGDYSATRDVDNPIRFACSKLASKHFVTLEEHRQRLLAIAEPASRILVVGNPALDGFRLEPKISSQQVLAALGVDSQAERPYCVVVHHPLYADPDAGAQEMELILKVLLKQQMRTVVGLPNSDSGSRRMIQLLESYKDNPNVVLYQSLERSLFVNLLRNATVLVGNSSMGLIEAPSIPLPVVNVGERQRGRTAAENVLFVDADRLQIEKALARVQSREFQQSLQGLENPYGDGHSTQRIVEALANQIDQNMVYKTEDPLKVGK